MFLLILICSVVIISIWLLWKYKLELIIIKGNSMSPTVDDGDLVLVDKLPRKPFNIGQICIIHPPDDENMAIKRVIKRTIFGGKKMYWFMGDNRNFSRDSREYGWVAENKVEGKVLKIWKRKQ